MGPLILLFFKRTWSHFCATAYCATTTLIGPGLCFQKGLISEWSINQSPKTFEVEIRHGVK